jgi:S1-C subfamily serine protease
MSLRYLVALLLLSVALSNHAVAQQLDQSKDPIRDLQEFNTLLMLSTFLIESVPPANVPPANVTRSLGTAFIMGRPMDHPTADQPNRRAYVLITANHVLDEMPGENATLYLRTKNGTGDWQVVPWRIKLRENGHNLWTKHPLADVAVMYVKIRNDIWIPTLSTELLADDSAVQRFELHPGDNLQCLGYPFGVVGQFGFPILRSGKVASYPLMPAEKIKTFLLDFPVFKGNSGGPVYFSENGRDYGGTIHMGEVVTFIAGLVSQEITADETFVGAYSQQVNKRPLGLAVIVPALFIKQAVMMLPSPDTNK